MGEVVGNEDGMCWLTAPAYDPDGRHEVVSPLFDNIEWGGVSCAVT